MSLERHCYRITVCKTCKAQVWNTEEFKHWDHSHLGGGNGRLLEGRAVIR